MKTAVVFLTVAGIVLCRPNPPDMPPIPPPGGPGGPEGMGGPFGSHWPHPPPPFLNGLSEQARQTYITIMKDMNNTIAKKKSDILAWAQANGVQAQVEEYEKNMTDYKEELKKNITDLIKELPSANKKFNEIIDNEDQSMSQIKTAMDTLSAENPKDPTQPCSTRPFYGAFPAHV
ncbi:unnamed protein product [Haemonchus placei]|uniref:DUF148 domain-containing protein n=1 Tax=Haemonchus placei TaxID=6290 RepID=A0A0N4WFZ0_HAEPC|nr:unnamed protein product [Haemonchus placei]